MYGRNGMDQLNRVLFWAYLILFMVQIPLVAVTKSQALSLVWDMAMWVLMLLIFFRMFSKNLSKRRAENGKWTAWVWKLKSGRQGAKARHADKDHRYFTCKQCKAICRVPVGKGKVVITCPKCGTQITGKT